MLERRRILKRLRKDFVTLPSYRANSVIVQKPEPSRSHQLLADFPLSDGFSKAVVTKVEPEDISKTRT